MIETYFSKTKYTKNKHRTRLNDESVAANLHLASTPDLIDDEKLLYSRGSRINPYAAWAASLKGKEALQKDYVGKRVSKNFCDDEGNRRPYLGTVRYVHWVQSEAQYCMHVSYDSDSDSEDMEEWELRGRICDDE